jgi:hypothetical protein
MVCALTPRDEVLALLTGVGPEPAEPAVDPPDADADGVLEGAPAIHTTVPIRMAPTMTSVRSWVERDRRMK